MDDSVEVVWWVNRRVGLLKMELVLIELTSLQHELIVNQESSNYLTVLLCKHDSDVSRKGDVWYAMSDLRIRDSPQVGLSVLP